MTTRILLALIICIALCFAIGCSKSSTTQASSESSSDSSSSPFKSSSKSSSGDDEEKEEDEEGDQAEETAFQRDVRNYTVEFAQEDDDPDLESFQRGLGAIAESHGITDWEQTDDTFVAVGRGLAESELDDSIAKEFAVVLSNEDYDDLMLIRSGYEVRNTQ
jgi:hypothetical protein